jgi:hypothetical protein
LSGTQLKEALTLARSIEYSAGRAMVLKLMAPQLKGKAKKAVLDEALAAALATQDAGRRAEALESLAPQLGGMQLGKALAAAREIQDKRSRARVLAVLGERLSGDAKTEVLDEALAAARTIRD